MSIRTFVVKASRKRKSIVTCSDGQGADQASQASSLLGFQWNGPDPLAIYDWDAGTAVKTISLIASPTWNSLPKDLDAHSKVGLKANMKETALDEIDQINGRFPIEWPNSFGESSWPAPNRNIVKLITAVLPFFIARCSVWNNSLAAKFQSCFRGEI